MVGSIIKPENRIAPDLSSLITNMYGLLTTNVVLTGIAVIEMPTFVAAAASVPCSLTSTTAL